MGFTINSMATPLLKRILLPTPKLKLEPFFRSHFSSSSLSGETPSISTIVSVLTHHCSKSRWRYLNSICPNGFNPDKFSQITLLLKNNPHLALRFFLWTQDKSLCNHNLLSYSTIIHILARGRLKSHAQNLLQTAIRITGSEDDPDSKPLKLFETLVKTYKQCGSAPFVFDLLIRALLDLKKIDPSIQIVRMLRSRGISPKVGTLNCLMSRVSKFHGANAGYEIYREFFDVGLEIGGENVKQVGKVSPTVRTFNVLMVGLYQDGMVEKVKEIWDQIGKLSNVAPNCYSYSILMAAFCEEKGMNEAEELFGEMKVKKIDPDVVAYNTIIGGFCKIGDIEKAEEFFREMELSGKSSTCVTYEHLIKGYSKIGDVDSVLLVYKDMHRKHFSPEPMVMEALIRCLCVKGRVLEGLEALRAAMGDCNFSPTGKSYEFLIEGLCQVGEIEVALMLQAEMVGKGFKSSLEIYSAFIDGCMKQGNEEMVDKLRNEMLEIAMNREDNE